jgi:hypothetical protein
MPDALLREALGAGGVHTPAELGSNPSPATEPDRDLTGLPSPGASPGSDAVRLPTVLREIEVACRRLGEAYPWAS